MHLSSPFAALLLTAGLNHAGHAQSRLARPTIDTLNHHIVRVMNNGPTAWTDTNGWKLVYERTVQPAEGTAGAFSSPSQMILLNDGQLVVVDAGYRAPPSIHLYDAQGRFKRILGRDGEGPGEYRSAEAAMIADTLVIQDQKLARVTLMTLAGKPIRSFPSVCCASGHAVAVGGGRIRTTTGGGKWTYFDMKGARMDSMAPPQAVKPKRWEYDVPGGHASTSIPLGAYNVHAELADGSVVFGGTDRAEFMVTRTGRDTVRIFGRIGLVGNPVAASMRDSLFRSATERNRDLQRTASSADIPARFPPWTWLYADGAGNIWIERHIDNTTLWGYDVFDPIGSFLGSVAAPFTSAEATSWSRDHVAVLDTDANDLPRIRIFRIDRRGH